ncbi:hypothetical protein D4764_0167590 [Takifugu flavidus]|uniref:Immunoglobulin V-set domain-containing protein n=1 Tax=Takifugu flavidus TaxID=433684 RepID=A0A5C6MJA9_9TELE|nr:hypothetical protein D4764_0167590 [Takifugu flavidus]
MTLITILIWTLTCCSFTGCSGQNRESELFSRSHTENFSITMLSIILTVIFLSQESSANNFLTQADKFKSVSVGGSVTISATGSSDIGSYLSWYLQNLDRLLNF